MLKKKNSLIGVYGIIFVIYSVLFMIIPFEKSGTDWVEYVFTVVAIGLSMGATFYAFGRDDRILSKIYGFPIFRVGILYLIIQIVMSATIIIIDSFVDVAVWIPVTVSLILLGLALTGIILTDNTRDIIEKQEAEDVKNTSMMKEILLSAEGARDFCSNLDLKKRLTGLVEKIMYSDPVSSAGLSEIEMKIYEAIEGLLQHDEADVIREVERIELLLADRNRRCKALK